MKQVHSLTKRLLFLVLMVAMLGGCTSDQYTEKTPAEEEMYLWVELRIPDASTPAVRAFVDGAQEKTIDKLDVLVFSVNKYSGAGEETFAYHAQGEPDGTENIYRVAVRKSNDLTEEFRFVFLANLHSEVTAAVNALTSPTTKTKAEVLETITFDASGVWNTTIAPLRYLPMWGESAETYLITSIEKSIAPVYMLRSVARVDVLLNPDANSSAENPLASGFGLPIFDLNSVRVHYASSEGVAVPDANYVNDQNLLTMEVTAPSVPGSATCLSAPIVYSIPTIAINQRQYGLTRTIYIAESAKTNMTSIVLSGKYNGSNDLSWYRLDFKDSDDSSLRLNILRNHCYMFHITSVNGPGYGSETEALNSQPIHIEYSAHDWSNGKISNIDINQQQYELSISQSVFNLSRQAWGAADADNILAVTTTCTAWTIDITYPDGGATGWLSTNPVSGVSGTTMIKLILDANPAGNAQRTGYIHLRAGTLTYKVKVIQAAAS